MILCTLFDSTYYAKGMALIESLMRHVPEFTLYILALDNRVASALEARAFRGVEVLRLGEIESPDILTAKANRSWREYCWTLGSCLTLYFIDQFRLPSIAYIDADCFVFSDLAPLYQEICNAPVAIIPHRYTPSQEARLKAAGTYNVGWAYFSGHGRYCLEHWRDQCVEWCYHQTLPDGRFADQGYLNDWPLHWETHVVQHLGVNLAPWNQEQYQYKPMGGTLIISDGKRADPLLFYHFHGFKGPGALRSGYTLDPTVVEHVYKPYEATWTKYQADGNSVEVTEAQLSAVTKELEQPENIKPFSAFIDAMHATGLVSGSLLDVGWGVGHYGVLCARHFPDVRYVGSDASVMMIERARKLVPSGVFVVSDFADNNFRAFDIVLLSQVV